MDSYLIEGVQLWADGGKVQAQDFSGCKGVLRQHRQRAQSGRSISHQKSESGPTLESARNCLPDDWLRWVGSRL
jgi:hypothetical protein